MLKRWLEKPRYVIFALQPTKKISCLKMLTCSTIVIWAAWNLSKFRVLSVQQFESDFWKKEIGYPVWYTYIRFRKAYISYYEINCFEMLLNVLYMLSFYRENLLRSLSARDKTNHQEHHCGCTHRIWLQRECARYIILHASLYIWSCNRVRCPL